MAEQVAREMDLGEFVATLPSGHRASREYSALLLRQPTVATQTLTLGCAAAFGFFAGAIVQGFVVNVFGVLA